MIPVSGLDKWGVKKSQDDPVLVISPAILYRGKSIRMIVGDYYTVCEQKGAMWCPQEELIMRGFLCPDGMFVDPKEAAMIAYTARQIPAMVSNLKDIDLLTQQS